MKNRYVKALITALVMSAFVSVSVFAEPNGEVQSLEIQKNEMETQAADVQAQLVDLLVSYDALQLDMQNQEQRIVESEADLSDAQLQEQEQYQAMKKRIRYLYETGDENFFETLISAESFTDLINKAEYIQNVHTYDRKQLDEYIKIKEEIENLKLELEAGQADMEQMAGEMQLQQTKLQSTLDDMRNRIADFDSQLETARAKAESQLTELTEATENIVASAEQGNSSSQTTGGGSANSGNNQNNKPVSSGGSQNTGGNTGSGSGTGSNSGGSSGTGSGNEGSGNVSKPDNASLGRQIANKACEYVGNPYVMGGTSLTNGADCSGFVQSVHKLFGISTPRTSSAQRSGGKAVNYSDMLPGDVICYSGHVAIYIGGNQIVHASNSAPYPQGGIKISSPPNYRTVLAVRRYW